MTSDRISVRVFGRRRHFVYFLPGTFLALYRSECQFNRKENNNNNENPEGMEEKQKFKQARLHPHHGYLRTAEPRASFIIISFETMIGKRSNMPKRGYLADILLRKTSSSP